MDDILLILRGILWAVFSFYQSQQKKKKKAAQQHASSKNAQKHDPYSDNKNTASQEDSFLDKVFNTIDSQHNDPYESFAEEATIEDADWDEEQAFERKKKEQTIKQQEKETKEDLKEVSNIRYKKHKTNKKKKLVREMTKDFDGKKAVIYSEILNRRYT